MFRVNERFGMKSAETLSILGSWIVSQKTIAP